MFKPRFQYTVESIKAIIERSEQRGGWMRREVSELQFFGVTDAITKKRLKQAILELRESGEYPAEIWYEVANKRFVLLLIERVCDRLRAGWLRIDFPWRRAARMRMLGLGRKKMNK